MARLSVITALFIGIIFCTPACNNQPERFTAPKFSLPLKNFNAVNSSTFATNKSYDEKFNSYAKECAYGIPESGKKLAELYTSTLAPNSKSYLYFQQQSFSQEYRYCRLTMKSRAKDSSEKNPEIYNQVLELLDASVPKEQDQIINIIYDFYKIDDATSAQSWVKKLELKERGDAPAQLRLGEFLFHKPDMQYQGYLLVENAARLSNSEALSVLKSKEFSEYRKNNDFLQKSYTNLIDKLTAESDNEPTEDNNEASDDNSTFGDSILAP